LPRRETRAPLWTRAYVFLLLAIFLCYMSQWVQWATLPLYVRDLGASVLIAGFVLAAFSVTGFGMRPVVGYWIDSWSHIGMLAVGTAILAVTGLLFTIPVLWVLFLGNLARGIGWASINTAGYTLLARVVPLQRRGEASAYYSVATNAATGLAPGAALWLIAPPVDSYVAVFVLSGSAALAATFVVRLLSAERAVRVEPGTKARGTRLQLSSLVDQRVLLASFLLVCVSITSPATTAFVPLYARELGIENSGAYFAVSAVISILASIVLGRQFDRGSRGLWSLLGFGLSLMGLAFILWATGIEMLVLGGGVYALGFSILSTILLAVAIDRADPTRPGAAMATFSAAYQLGMGLGAPISGWLIETFGYGGMYLGTMITVGGGLLLTAINWTALRRPAAAMVGTGQGRGAST
jgi:MFS family permease